MKAGDIVRIYAPVAGKHKYHFCVLLPESQKSGRFLFLNSQSHYRDCLEIDGSSIPDLPLSRTGKTVISFSLLLRYNEEKLRSNEAKVVGRLPRDVLRLMLDFLETVTSLPAPDKDVVRNALKSLLD